MLLRRVVFVAVRAKHILIQWESTVDLVVALLLKHLIHVDLVVLVEVLRVRAFVGGESEVLALVSARYVIIR